MFNLSTPDGLESCRDGRLILSGGQEHEPDPAVVAFFFCFLFLRRCDGRVLFVEKVGQNSRVCVFGRRLFKDAGLAHLVE